MCMHQWSIPMHQSSMLLRKNQLKTLLKCLTWSFKKNATTGPGRESHRPRAPALAASVNTNQVHNRFFSQKRVYNWPFGQSLHWDCSPSGLLILSLRFTSPGGGSWRGVRAYIYIYIYICIETRTNTYTPAPSPPPSPGGRVQKRVINCRLDMIQCTLLTHKISSRRPRPCGCRGRRPRSRAAWSPKSLFLNQHLDCSWKNANFDAFWSKMIKYLIFLLKNENVDSISLENHWKPKH